MADTQNNQEADEFGALAHEGVSSLRSRFEQLSQSERPPAGASSATVGSRPSSSAGFPRPSGARSLSARPPPSQHAMTVSGGASADVAATPSSAGTSSLRQPPPQTSSSSRSVSPLPGSSASSASADANSRPAHTKKPSDQKAVKQAPTAFGAAPPSLIINKPATAGQHHPSGGRNAAAATAAATPPQPQQPASAPTTTTKASSSTTPSIKVPPPRPPKPAEKFKILDDADLEHLRSQARVASLASKFTHGAQEGADRFSMAMNQAFSSQHARQRSHPAETTLRAPSHKDAPPRPAIPPKPLKGDPSSDSLLAMPGTMAALAIDADGYSPEVDGTSSVLSSGPSGAPPPLPSRTPDKSAADSVRRRRFSLSASKSTGSLPLLRDPLDDDRTPPLPPLPARRGPGAAPEINAAPSPAVLPPPQRVQPTATAAAATSAPVSRSVSSAYSIPTTTTASGPDVPARSGTGYTIQPPPPPPGGARLLERSHTHSRFFSSTHSSTPARPPARDDGSDSSDEDEYGEMAAHLLPPSSLAGPLSAGRPAGALGMPSAAELPDTSRANRRAPKFSPDCTTAARAAFQCFAACGHTVVTGSGDKVKVYRVGELATGLGEKLCTVGEHGNSKELKLTALEFRPPNHGVPPVPAMGIRSHGETADEGRYLWCGTKDGHLWELDVAEARTVHSRVNVHSAPIQLLRRIGNKMISMDESGKISVWLPQANEDPSLQGLRLSNQPITQRIALEKGSFAVMLGQQLWVAGPVSPRSAKDYNGSKGPRIRIYNPFADDKPFNATSKAVMMPPEMANGVGSVTGGTIVPTKPDRACLAHDSGHVSIWSRQTFECISVHKLGPGITAVAGVVKYLWAANRSGNIAVYDIDATPWRALKIWPAHKEPVMSIRVDEHGIGKVGRLQVASAGLDATVHLWDGTLSFDWIQLEKSKREVEFCTYRNLKILQATFNVDAANPVDLETSAENMELFPNMLRNACAVGGDPKAGGVTPDRPPDIIVFGFQELIDLESKKLTAKSLLLGSGKKRANDFGDRVSRQYRAWHDKLTSLVRLAMPPTCGYLLVQSESLVGLFTCVFVKQAEFKHVKETAISTVKTGMGGRYGNKGAVIARMVIDHTSLCFANCHLAAGQKHIKQRNADVADILESPTVFDDHYADPAAYVGGGDGSMILDHELCFWGGDLNYRIDLKRDTVLSAVGSSRLGPLVEADQLRRELKNNPTFRLKSFSEAPLSFLPTYKYDRGTHEWDTSEKSRIPAWCDRILWRSHNPDRIRCLEYRRWEATISDHRPVTAIFEAKVKAIDPAKSKVVEDELKARWATLEHGILETAEKYYDDPV
ncbi:uncharacterized protein PFL1_00979 [Pseudozyma flocculosa PF-1]|uniref:Inositol polyphosphate-related phosphatase domain-containing protein n=1 Tax=Pseudozyma flocculosa TaxID=84751 RepID=A0A5C3F976_9BASI|nr:uncharacterized protein PFL1_00979 [Pseudozyma flocculosa PF-1]EPQ31646.1 hypothetical protein PFL1_00979 [Pseudozyma flocculosa PF-1]SPO40760.1 uncharacterized protein PSFLO_06242 [Pseudozyma flocculosa]